MDGEIPAEATTEAPQEATTETPAAVAPEATPASETVATEAPRAAEPDIDRLFEDDAFVERILQHEKAQHRIKSVRQADIDRRAQEQAEQMVQRYQQEQAQRQAADERRRKLQELEQAKGDDYAYSQKATEIADYFISEEKRNEFQRQQQEWMKNQHSAVLKAVHDAITSEVVNQSEVLTDQDKAELVAERFPTATAWAKAVYDREKQRLREIDVPKRAKALALAEAEAIVQERLKEHRAQAPAPVVLPAAEAGSSDSEFAAAYGSGESNDTARQINWMRKHGVL